jgi:hypothetical protein
MRYACILLTLLLLCPVPVHGDEEPNIEFFYPLVTRRPVIERRGIAVRAVRAAYALASSATTFARTWPN